MNDPLSKSSDPAKPARGWFGERFRGIELVAALAVAFYLCYTLARPFLSILAWSVALAVVFDPMHRWLLQRLHFRTLSAGASVLIIALAVVVPLSFVIPNLVTRAIDGINLVRQQLEGGDWQETLEQRAWIKPAWEWIEARVDLKATVHNGAVSLTAFASALVTGSVRGVLELLIVFFMVFYFFRDRDRALASIRSLLPLRPTETGRVFTWIEDTLFATVYGTVLVGVFQGILGGLMFWWLGLTAPFFWAMVIGILAILPVVGSSLVWVPAAVLLAANGHWGKAILLVLWGSLVMGLLSNWLYSILVGRRLRLHTMAVFLAMIGGLLAFGACGFFLGPVILAVTHALLEIWKERSGSVMETTAGPYTI